MVDENLHIIEPGRCLRIRVCCAEEGNALENDVLSEFEIHIGAGASGSMYARAARKKGLVTVNVDEASDPLVEVRAELSLLRSCGRDIERNLKRVEAICDQFNRGIK